MPVTLAIETSQRVGGVALRAPTGLVTVEKLASKKRHDDDLLPAIDRLFARSGLKPDDLRGGAVGVSIGPGGFTGLRIAVATAKMFAEALDAKVIAVPSALVVAESVTNRNSIMVALAAKAESVWATRLTRVHGDWTIVGTPALASAHSIELGGIEALLGDEHLSKGFCDACEAMRIPVVEPIFDSRACLAMAERMLAGGQTVDPLVLSPLYPREPEAVTLWNMKRPAPATPQGRSGNS